jgi:Tfp pilus assembly protein PilF
MTIGPRGSIAVALALVCAACATPTAEEPASPPPKEGIATPPAAPRPELRPAAPREPAPAAREKSRAEQDFERGVKSYEDGDYKSAARQLQSALSLGLPAFPDQASAHKYLAFIACASGRQRPCRDEFRKAFEADGNFNLTPAEAGHPVWGPVFRSVKAEMAKARPK